MPVIKGWVSATSEEEAAASTLLFRTKKSQLMYQHCFEGLWFFWSKDTFSIIDLARKSTCPPVVGSTTTPPASLKIHNQDLHNAPLLRSAWCIFVFHCQWFTEKATYRIFCQNLNIDCCGHPNRSTWQGDMGQRSPRYGSRTQSSSQRPPSPSRQGWCPQSRKHGLISPM